MAREIIDIRLTLLMPDIIGTIMIHAVEVVAALDERGFFGSELGKPRAELLAHAIRVLAEVDGIAEPGDCKFDFTRAGLDVGGVVGVPGLGPVA